MLKRPFKKRWVINANNGVVSTLTTCYARASLTNFLGAETVGGGKIQYSLPMRDGDLC
jgi:hypothetical protein